MEVHNFLYTFICVWDLELTSNKNNEIKNQHTTKMHQKTPNSINNNFFDYFSTKHHLTIHFMKNIINISLLKA